MPNVSIIIPFINGEKYLEKCIENIKKQKYQNYEIILIDDGSEDKSKEIIQKYINDKKIEYHYLEKSSVGVGKARNYGIKVAKGKYIMFVDVDDYINENLLNDLQTYINQGIELIKYKMKIINPNQKEEKCDGPSFLVPISGEEAFNSLCFEDKFLDSPCLYLIKKELLERTNLEFTENRYHEDFGLIPKLITKAKTMVSTDCYGYYYVQSEESIIRTKDYQKKLKKVNDKLEHYKNMMNFLETANLAPTTEKNIKIYYTNSIIMSLKFLKKEDRKILERKIKNLHMIGNLKNNSIKQFLKKCFLSVSIELYLKFEKLYGTLRKDL